MYRSTKNPFLNFRPPVNSQHGLASKRAVSFLQLTKPVNFFVSADPEGKLAVFNRTFNRVMGLCVDSNQLYLSDLYQLWRFENTLEHGQSYKQFDRCYLPQMCCTTGDLDAHDIGLGRDGKPVFINTLFSCIATVSDTHSFKPI